MRKMEVQRGVMLGAQEDKESQGSVWEPLPAICGPTTRHLVGTRLAVPKTKIPSVAAVAAPNYSQSPGDRGCQNQPGGDTGARIPPRSLDSTPAPWEGLVIVLCPQGETEGFNPSSKVTDMKWMVKTKHINTNSTYLPGSEPRAVHIKAT